MPCPALQDSYILQDRALHNVPAKLYHFVFRGMCRTAHGVADEGVATLAGSDRLLSLPLKSTAVTAYS